MVRPRPHVRAHRAGLASEERMALVRELAALVVAAVTEGDQSATHEESDVDKRERLEGWHGRAAGSSFVSS